VNKDYQMEQFSRHLMRIMRASDGVRLDWKWRTWYQDATTTNASDVKSI